MNVKWGDYAVFGDGDGDTDPLFVIEIIYNEYGKTYGCKQLRDNSVTDTMGNTVFYHHDSLIECYDGDKIREQWDRTIGIANLIPGCKIKRIVFNRDRIQFNCEVDTRDGVLK